MKVLVGDSNKEKAILVWAFSGHCEIFAKVR